MIDTSTYLALKTAQIGSIRQLARSLEESPATLSDILRGRHEHVHWRTENRIRRKLGLPPRSGRSPWFRPCLSRDPAVRVAQLRRLLAEAEGE